MEGMLGGGMDAPPRWSVIIKAVGGVHAALLPVGSKILSQGVMMSERSRCVRDT